MTGDDLVALVAFLTARLGEDEAGARLAAREGGTWTQVDPVRYCGRIEAAGGVVVYDEGSPDEYQAPHIARHDPARVLREVAAKRAHIRAWGAITPDSHDPIDDHDWREFGAREALKEVLRTDAAVYSSHAGYRPEWAPPG